MTVTPTYDSTLSRVRVAATGLGSAATALFERSVDQIAWTTVRGGTSVPVVSGAASLDDYEFSPDVVNYYRVTSAKDIVLVGIGSLVHGNNTSISPGLPTGHTSGDVLVLAAAIHNSGVGTPNTPAGYTLLLNAANLRVFGKVDGGSESAPSVSFTGGVAGPVTAQMVALRNVPLSLEAFAHQLNSSAQNIAYPTLDVLSPHSALIYIGWALKQWTSVATLTGDGGTAGEIGEPTTTQSSIGQGIVWDWLVQNTVQPTDVAAGSFVVTGGGSSISRGAVMSLPATPLLQTASITPTLTTLWIKSIGRPFLNTAAVPLKPVPIDESEARNGVFEVIGRSDPVAITDVRANRGYVLRVLAETDEEQSRLDLLIESGDPIFLHLPADFPKPSMYAVIGAKSFDPLTGVYTLPLRKVAAPGPDVVGATATWQTVINTYATWADVIAANATWANLLELVASPSEVIVP